MNGLSHPYHLDGSTLTLRGVRSNYSFYSIFDDILVSKQFSLTFLAPQIEYSAFLLVSTKLIFLACIR